MRSRRQCERLSSNTVLQLKVLVFIYTLAASVHHAALLNSSPLLPPLLVEFSYNAYNIFLITNLFITVCFCREFVDRTQSILGGETAKRGPRRVF
jgi:hypothetical protein